MIDQVVDVVRIVLQVVQFFGPAFGREVTGLNFIGGAIVDRFVPRLCRFHLPHVRQILHPRHVGHVVADVNEPFIENGSGVVESFIHSPAEGEVIFRFGLGLRAQKDCPLHRVWNFALRDAQPGLGHVHEADQPIDLVSRFGRRPEMPVTFRNPNDQRAVKSIAKKKTLAAWQHAAMVRAVNNYRIVGHSGFFKFLQRVTDFLIHVFDRVMVSSVVASHVGHIWMVLG